MPNLPPIAVLGASATEINVNEVIDFYTDRSYDPNRRGRIVKRVISQDSGPAGGIKQISTDGITFRCKGTLVGKYQVRLTVEDVRGATGTDIILINVKSQTVSLKLIGAHGDTIPDAQAVRMFNSKTPISRGQIFLEDNTDRDGHVDKFLEDGVPMVCNINNKHVGRTAAGDKIPNPFVPTAEIPAYKNKLRPIFQYYKNKLDTLNNPNIDVYFPIENEPTQSNSFHYWNPTNPQQSADLYLGQCRAACEVAAEAEFEGKIKILDGGLHVETVNGANTSEGTSDKAGMLLAGYKDIPFWGLLIHTSTKTDNYADGAIEKAFAKMRSVTGKPDLPIGSNEWHVGSKTFVNAVVEILDQFFTAGAFCIIYITGTDPSTVLNNGPDLTPIGRAYQTEITKLLANV